MSADTPHLVKRYSKYKLGNGQFTHDADADRLFPTKAEADSYAATADGMTSDTYYRYEVSPATTTEQAARELAAHKEEQERKRLADIERQRGRKKPKAIWAAKAMRAMAKLRGERPPTTNELRAARVKALNQLNGGKARQAIN